MHSGSVSTAPEPVRTSASAGRQSLSALSKICAVALLGNGLAYVCEYLVAIITVGLSWVALLAGPGLHPHLMDYRWSDPETCPLGTNSRRNSRLCHTSYLSHNTSHTLWTAPSSEQPVSLWLTNCYVCLWIGRYH